MRNSRKINRLLVLILALAELLVLVTPACALEPVIMDGSTTDSGVQEGQAYPFYCVRQGATGANDGSDWENAYTELPAALVRGATYYIADGNYPGFTVDAPELGEKYITVQKATSADHGTDTGWSEEYGDGQAVFAPTYITKSYVILDGCVRGEDWMSGYGMKFTTEGTAGQWSMVVNSCGNIALRNIEFDGKGQENCLYVKNGVPRPSNIIVSRCYLHDANNPIAAANSYNILLEYSRILRNWSSPTHHGQGFVLWSADRVCVRYNIFGDIVGTAYIAGAWGNDDWQIYGNVFYRSPGYAKGVGTGAIVDISVPPETGAQNWKIYNNLFINLGNLNVGISIDVSRGGNEAYNNIWYNCSASAIRFKNIIHDYNYFYNNEITSNGVTDAQLAASELHGQLGTEDPLVDWQNGDFRPVMATDPGLDVCSLPGVNCAETPFNIDMFGNIRGADGVWDRGAAEFIAGTDYPPIVRSATLENLTTLRVVFSEALEPVSAANISNYSVDQGVVVQSAAVDDRTVTLTLSGARYDTVYTLTVNNLRDLTGNVIAPDSQKQFSRENIIDNADARGVTVSAGWIVSTYNAGRYGANYVHDDNTGKGTKSVTFIPDLSEAGSYEVYMWYPASSGYATNVPVDIAHRGGTDTVTVNEQLNGSKWNLLGVYDFEARSTGHVRIRTDGTDGYVIADAVKFVKVALPGDANLDGAVNIADAIAVAKYCVGISLPKFDAKNADVDCNPGVTINDAITIAKYVVRAIQEWPDCGG